MAHLVCILIHTAVKQLPGGGGKQETEGKVSLMMLPYNGVIQRFTASSLDRLPLVTTTSSH